MMLVDQNPLKKAALTANQSVQIAWGSPPYNEQYFESVYAGSLTLCRYLSPAALIKIFISSHEKNFQLTPTSKYRLY